MVWLGFPRIIFLHLLFFFIAFYYENICIYRKVQTHYLIILNILPYFSFLLKQLNYKQHDILSLNIYCAPNNKENSYTTTIPLTYQRKLNFIDLVSCNIQFHILNFPDNPNVYGSYLHLPLPQFFIQMRIFNFLVSLVFFNLELVPQLYFVFCDMDIFGESRPVFL